MPADGIACSPFGCAGAAYHAVVKEKISNNGILTSAEWVKYACPLGSDLARLVWPVAQRPL
jgi:hypothetical protein